jgi:hypothetical protein
MSIQLDQDTKMSGQLKEGSQIKHFKANKLSEKEGWAS